MMETRETVTRTVEESRVENVHIVRPEHMNSAGRMFGGALMQWIDEVAGLVAKRHAHTMVTTASVDNLHFITSAYLNDVVVLIGRITYVGNSSMEVRVDTYVESINGTRTPINRAYLTVVALDEAGKPVRVPRLTLSNPTEEAEWEGGIKRREMRMRRREEGF